MDQSGITPNTSNQQLVTNGDNESATALLEKQTRRSVRVRDLSSTDLMTVAILCFVNLINYMDRFTLAGVLGDVKDEFKIGDDEAGLLQTVFVMAYMVFAPIFGYFGDRYSRRYIMAFGVSLWCLTTFIGSFLKQYGLFALFRGLVGIGEASYSTIAPTIISDLYVGNLRSKMLAIFYFAIPVGSGLGYIVGSETGALAGDWRWGLRVTPFLGAVAVALIIWVMVDPERGQAEESHIKPTSYREDIFGLIRNPSFMLTTLAFTCVAFTTGALSWWGPQYIYLGLSSQPGVNLNLKRVSLVFGLIAMFAGLLGVPLGAWLGAVLYKRWPRAHPIVCGGGLIVSAPLISLTIYLCYDHWVLPFVLLFFGEIALNLNWAVVTDLTLYVVIPPRRSTAEAFQILISHMFGDAGSPYLVGVVSEALKRSLTGTKKSVQFRSLQYALFLTLFVQIMGAAFFFLTALYVVRDKKKVDLAISEADAAHAEITHSSANSSATAAATPH